MRCAVSSPVYGRAPRDTLCLVASPVRVVLTVISPVCRRRSVPHYRAVTVAGRHVLGFVDTDPAVLTPGGVGYSSMIDQVTASIRNISRLDSR